MLHQKLSPHGRATCVTSPFLDCLRRYVILIGPDFSLLNLSGFTQALRIANQLHGAGTFTWTLVSENGGPVTSSCGLETPVQSGLPAPYGLDYIVVNTAAHAQLSQKSKGWLNTATRHGSSIGAFDGAVIAMARSGCLPADAPWSVHWQHFEAMREQYPEKTFSRRSYQRDGASFSGVGATAGIDLALSEVEHLINSDIARKVADEMNYSAQFKLQSLAVDRHPVLSQIDNDKLRTVIAEMERTIEDAPSTLYFAEYAKISSRQLERLFQDHLKQTPRKFFVNMRLDHGRNLLLNTDLNLMDVAICSGFSTPAMFSKKFRDRFGMSPATLRGT